MFAPEILLTLKLNHQLFTDPRRIALLKAIERTGSLTQAAKLINISYKTAWDAIKEINRLAPKPFLSTITGGKNGGGTKLSAYAVRFIQLYDLLTQIQHNAFKILSNDRVPLDDILQTTAKLSLQTSARNQLYGTVQQILTNGIAGFITVKLSDEQTELKVYITQHSVERLQLSAEKTVLLLIKAPLINITDSGENSLQVTVDKITCNEQWSEIVLTLASGITLYASQPIDIVKQLGLTEGQHTRLSIHPEHIIVATLV